MEALAEAGAGAGVAVPWMEALTEAGGGAGAAVPYVEALTEASGGAGAAVPWVEALTEAGGGAGAAVPWVDQRTDLFLGASTSHFTETSRNQSPGSMYASSQSQEEWLVRIENIQNEMFMITGRYGRVTSEDPMPTNAQTRTGPSKVENNQCREEFPFVENPIFESLQDLNFDTEQAEEAVEHTSVQLLDEYEQSVNQKMSFPLDIKEKKSDMAVENVGEQKNTEMGVEIEQLTQDDILVFLEDESIVAARTCSQEVRSHHVPLVDMAFDDQEATYGFYNESSTIATFGMGRDHESSDVLCAFSMVVMDHENELLERNKKDLKENIERVLQ
ncbi:hypothetical protein D1007_18167 [Hordeum vulgare]|nr:hypothetical protein D1007_18167 [Hordeum vulgare]